MRASASIVLCLLLLTGCGFAVRALGRTLSLPPEPQKLRAKLHDVRRPDARLSVLWIGHATALVQLDDKFVLTDPVFTTSVGGISTRLWEPGLDPSDLPQLAAAIVSHTHMDHLSFDSLAMLEHKTQLVVLPPDARENMPRYAFETRELSRWQSLDADGVRVTAVPVKHVGGRFGVDLGFSPRSFTGYVLEYHGLTVYFGGDSAFDPESFRATRASFPAIDLALLPICPIAPREHMRRVHMDPQEAVAAFELLGATYMVPIHFDTFINSDDWPGDCGRALERARVREQLPQHRLAVLQIGEQRVLLSR